MAFVFKSRFLAQSSLFVPENSVKKCNLRYILSVPAYFIIWIWQPSYKLTIQIWIQIDGQVHIPILIIEPSSVVPRFRV